MRFLVTAAIAAVAVPADGQAAPPPVVPAAPAPDIVVSADRQAATSTIDRKAYAVDRDLSAGSGSVADVLRNLPSVEVDAQGNVSLRGDSSIQVLIDGKSSAQMAPATRADALQSLPASGIESVEVITNPSARFKADGSGGVINIITKKNRKPGTSGTATASTGTDGRYNLGATAAYHRGKLDLNSALTLRRDVPKRPLSDRRTRIDAVTGAATDSRQDLYFTSRRTSKIATLGAGYDLTKADRLSGSFTYNDRVGAPQQRERNRLFDAAGIMTGDYDRNALGTEHEVASEGSATYKHSFAGKGHAFTLDLRRGEEAETQSRRFTTTYRMPLLATTIDRQSPHADMTERELTAEYTRPMAAHAKLVVGYDLQRNDDAFDSRGETIDPVTGAATIDPTQTSRFVYAQTVHAFYATYERVFADKLTAILGFRVEATSSTANQVTIGQVDRTRYVNAYPTLHLDDALSDTTTLRLSYSHRIVRPRPEDLDPFPVFSDPLNLRAGNPRLKPQETDAIEGAFAYTPHGLSIEVTPYYRRTTNLFTQVVRYISPTVLLTTQANLGASTAAGVDFSGNGKIGKALSFGLSGSLFHNAIDAANLGIAGMRSIVSGTAKGNLDYKLTGKDLIQLTANFTGKRLLPQGFRLPGASANLGYRHQFKPTLSLVATLADVFDSQKDRTVLDTPTLHDASTRRRSTRTATIALAWTFGGTPKKAAKIDYAEP
jgi:outer membrane receptor protein involved in Fe transport